MKKIRKTGARKRKRILQDRILAIMGFDFGDEFDQEKAEALHHDFINSLGRDDDLPDLNQFLETVITVSRMVADSAENMEFRDDAELQQYIDNYFREFTAERPVFSRN